MPENNIKIEPITTLPGTFVIPNWTHSVSTITHINTTVPLTYSGQIWGGSGGTLDGYSLAKAVDSWEAPYSKRFCTKAARPIRECKR